MNTIRKAFSSTQRGMTIIEILVVIAIIAILGSIVASTVFAARKQARIREAESLVSTLSFAIDQYYDDQKEMPRSDNDPTRATDFSHTSVNPSLEHQLLFHGRNPPYLAAKDIAWHDFSIIDDDTEFNQKLVDPFDSALPFLYARMPWRGSQVVGGRKEMNKLPGLIGRYHIWGAGDNGVYDCGSVTLSGNTISFNDDSGNPLTVTLENGVLSDVTDGPIGGDQDPLDDIINWGK